MEKKKVGISKKEKLLLLVVATGAAFALLYTMVYEPLLVQVEDARLEAEALITDYTSRRSLIDQLPAKQAQLQELTEKSASTLDQFYGVQPQEDYIHLLYRLSEESGLTIKSANFSKNNQEFSASGDLGVTFKPPVETPAAEGADATPDPPPILDQLLTEEHIKFWESNLYTTAVSISYVSSVQELVAFLGMLEQTNKNMLISNLTLTLESKPEDKVYFSADILSELDSIAAFGINPVATGTLNIMIPQLESVEVLDYRLKSYYP